MRRRIAEFYNQTPRNDLRLNSLEPCLSDSEYLQRQRLSGAPKPTRKRVLFIATSSIYLAIFLCNKQLFLLLVTAIFKNAFA